MPGGRKKRAKVECCKSDDEKLGKAKKPGNKRKNDSEEAMGNKRVSKSAKVTRAASSSGKDGKKDMTPSEKEVAEIRERAKKALEALEVLESGRYILK